MSGGAKRRRLRAAAAIALLPLLAGCGGLLSKAPDRPLYRLNPAFEQRRLPPSGAQLVIATPAASAGLDTKRIALIRSPVAIDYFADAEWVDRPPFLVKQALIEAFDKSRAFAGVASEGAGINADFVLNIEIREFAALYDSPDAAPLVRVRLDGELITMSGRTIIAETSVSREARAAANDIAATVLAFERAAGGAIDGLLTWTASHPGLSRKRR